MKMHEMNKKQLYGKPELTDFGHGKVQVIKGGRRIAGAGVGEPGTAESDTIGKCGLFLHHTMPKWR